MIKLDGVSAFVAVAETGSITEAARRLQLSKSVVSERLSELERGLGASLLQRTTRKTALTEDGAAFLGRARHILAELADATAELAERRGGLVGPLRISAPLSFGVLHLGPALYPFLRDNPGIELTLDLDDRFVNIDGDGYDAVVRHGPIDDSRLVAKRLAVSRRVLAASPDYLERAGAPADLDALSRHAAVLYTNRGEGDWRFETGDGIRVVRPRAPLRVNNGLIMREAAIAGLGIALLPVFMAHRELADGRLRVINVGAEAERAMIYGAYPRERRVSVKVLAMIERLREAFGSPPYWGGVEDPV